MRFRNLRNTVFLFAFLLLTIVAMPCQTPRPMATPSPTVERIQAKTYQFKEANTEMGYELYVPTKYDKSKPAPLIIALHGLGSNPSQIIRYQGLTDLAEERGYIIAAPMGYNNHGWYGNLGQKRAGIYKATDQDPENLGELSEKDVLNVLDIVRKDFNIDPKRIYLFGHSMGGGGTLYLGIKYPDIWAALAPAAPAIYSSPDQLEKIKSTPIIVVQGDNDKLVNVDTTRKWIAKMKELGMNYEYIEVPGGDHVSVIYSTPANMKKIFDFFDKAKRQ
jgi:predicted peptidase